MALFVVLRKTKARWVAGKSPREQAYWDEHAQFMDRLFEEGKILLAGPFTDGSGALVIVRTATLAEAQAIFDEDRWVVEDILDQGEVKPWQIFLNSYDSQPPLPE